MNIRNFFARETRLLTLSAILFATGGALLLAPKTSAWAQGAPCAKVEADLQAFKVAGTKLVAATSARPGEVIEYQARYTNTGSASAQRFAPQLPVPASLVYVSSSALPEGVMASTDGKNFAPAPLMRVVKAADGTTKSVAIPLREYRVLRWQLGTLAPGQSVTVKARARVKAFADGK